MSAEALDLSWLSQNQGCFACRQYTRAMKGIRKLLLVRNSRAPDGLLYVAEKRRNSAIKDPKMDHLVCFLPGESYLLEHLVCPGESYLMDHLVCFLPGESYLIVTSCGCLCTTTPTSEYPVHEHVKNICEMHVSCHRELRCPGSSLKVSWLCMKTCGIVRQWPLLSSRQSSNIQTGFFRKACCQEVIVSPTDNMLSAVAEMVQMAWRRCAGSGTLTWRQHWEQVRAK